MFLVGPGQKIWIACYAIDFRKGLDGLMAESYRMGIDPFKGDIIIFISKDKRKAKILACNNIYAQLDYRRLHRGSFQIPFLPEKGCRQIDPAETQLFLEGHRYMINKRTLPWPTP